MPEDATIALEVSITMLSGEESREESMLLSGSVFEESILDRISLLLAFSDDVCEDMVEVGLLVVLCTDTISDAVLGSAKTGAVPNNAMINKTATLFLHLCGIIFKNHSFQQNKG